MLTIHFECVETCSHYNDTNNFYHSIIRRMLFQKQEILLSWIQQNIDIKFYQRILAKLDWAWVSFFIDGSDCNKMFEDYEICFHEMQ